MKKMIIAVALAGAALSGCSSASASSGDYDYGFAKGHDSWMRLPDMFDEQGYEELCGSYATEAASYYENVDQDEIVDGCIDGVAEARENPLG